MPYAGTPRVFATVWVEGSHQERLPERGELPFGRWGTPRHLRCLGTSKDTPSHHSKDLVQKCNALRSLILKLAIEEFCPWKVHLDDFESLYTRIRSHWRMIRGEIIQETWSNHIPHSNRALQRALQIEHCLMKQSKKLSWFLWVRTLKTNRCTVKHCYSVSCFVT